MLPYKKHLITEGSSIKQGLSQLDELAADALLFVVDNEGRLIGSLTDGDVRRGFLRGLSLEDNVEEFAHRNAKYLIKGNYSIEQIIDFRSKNYRIIPVVGQDKRIINIINFRFHKSYLPVDAVIMAGGRGERLKPLTDNTPKPMLKVGDLPIIEHHIDRLISFGIDDLWLSLYYLGEQIEKYFDDGSSKHIRISYVREKKPMGTIGAVSQIEDFKHNHVLVTNSDILTNLDYENFFLEFIKSEAELSVVTIPYQVSIPYAVLETMNGHVLSFKEKPTYTYYSNGGIYLMKREILKLIPSNQFYNATDLLEFLIKDGHKVHSYPLRGYWLDIGKHEDYLQAQKDITHLNFS